MTIRHHLEFQGGRMADPIKTGDYEEFIFRYDPESEPPTLEQWEDEMIKLYGGTTGRVRVWKVTREEIEVVQVLQNEEV